jgi:hypothetical protein
VSPEVEPHADRNEERVKRRKKRQRVPSDARYVTHQPMEAQGDVGNGEPNSDREQAERVFE